MCHPGAEWYQVAVALIALTLGTSHRTAVQAIGSGVLALLGAQSLHPAALARALPDLQTSRGRQALRRVRRLVQRAWLGSGSLTPGLVRLALRLVPEGEVVLVLDSTRCGRWEVVTLGVRWGGCGRVLVVGWAVLPYPWPKGQFTPTVLALLTRVLRAWPADRPVHLVADRGFPSLELFRTLAAWQARLTLGYTIRLRAGDYVRLSDGRVEPVRTWLLGVQPGEGTLVRAAYRRQAETAPPSWRFVGRGPSVLGWHQSGPADQRRRVQRARQCAAYLQRKGQAGAVATDHVWALLSTEADPALSTARYAERFATEPTYRDLHGWHLEAVVQAEPDRRVVDGLVGLASLAYLLHLVLGLAAGRTADPAAVARQASWSTTDRLSASWRGRQVLHDRGHDWQPWLHATLAQLWLDLDPRAARSALTHHPTRPSPQQEAA